MYLLSQDQVNQIQAAASNAGSLHPFADMYNLIHSYLEQPDDFGNVVSGSVFAWFGAAAQANLGQGGASTFINDFTATQLAIRTGSPVSNVEDLLQRASDDIASAVLADILSSTTIEGGETYYVLPTLNEIGIHDALEALDVLQVHSDDPAVWSGNALFLGLGDGSFWQNNVLTNAGDTYNLFVTADAFIGASTRSFLQGASGDLVGLFFSQGAAGSAEALQTVSAGYSAANSFLNATYQRFITTGLPDLALTSLAIGTEGDDQAGIVAPSDTFSTVATFMHGGPGDDLLIGSAGNDILDGGTDHDVVSFEQLAAFSGLGLTVYLDRITTSAQFAASVSAEGVNSDLYNVEELSTGNRDDTLLISDLSDITTSLEVIDALDEVENGDTIDLSMFTFAGFSVSLLTETASPENDAVSISVRNFENVIGTGNSDNIVGSDVANFIVGGDGVDVIRGGLGNDTLTFDINDSVVDGGGDEDVAIFDDRTDENGGTSDTLHWNPSDDRNAEAVIGGMGDDTLLASAEGGEILAGGEGNDTFFVPWVSSGSQPTVIWGGAGIDRITFSMSEYGGWDSVTEDYPPFFGPDYLPLVSDFLWSTGQNEALGILVVDVPNITDENFQHFDLSSLGYSDELLSEIDVVLINPDSEDRLFHETPDGQTIELGVTNAVSASGNPYITVADGTPSNEPQRYVSNHTLTLGGTTVNVFSGGTDLNTGYIDGNGNSVSVDHHYGWLDGYENSFIGGALNNTDYGIFTTASDIGAFTSTGAIGGRNSNWFVVGGEFAGSSVLTNSPPITITIEAPEPPQIDEGTEFDDTYNGNDNPDPMRPIIYNAGDGNDTATGGAGDDELNGENGNDDVAGGEGSDTITGGSGSDNLLGNFNDDHIEGGDGNDYAHGGRDNDYIEGGAGLDTVNGGKGDDTVFGGDDVDSVLGGDGADFLYGNQGDDTLLGGNDDDWMHGGQNNDSLDGEGGADTVNGGVGDDTVFGGDGTDNVLGGSGIDFLYGNTGDDTLDGGADDDWMHGGQGADSLIGGTGVDTLNGGLGDDTMTGGSHADEFRFWEGSGADVITDFQDGIDEIVFNIDGVSTTAQAMAAATQVGNDVVFDFGGGDVLTVLGVTETALQDDLVIL